MRVIGKAEIIEVGCGPETSPEERLLQGVLLMAMRDAQATIPSGRSGRSAAEIKAAREWLHSESYDAWSANWVCDLLNYDREELAAKVPHPHERIAPNEVKRERDRRYVAMNKDSLNRHRRARYHARKIEAKQRLAA